MTNYLTPVDPNSYTFMGRLLRELMRVTDPKYALNSYNLYIFTQSLYNNNTILFYIISLLRVGARFI